MGENKSKECQKCVDLNATKCKEDKRDDSTECKEGFILMPLTKKCVKLEICKDGSFYVEKTNECKKCPKECTKCENASHCSECKNGSEPVSGICNSECPNKKTLVDGKCVNCKDPLCKNCDENRECIKCEKGAFLNPDDNTCSKSCPNGTYPNSDNECSPCSNDCEECDSSTNCTKCKEGLFSIDSSKNGQGIKCTDKCPSNMYADENDGKCKNCSKGCDKCSSLTDCDVCHSPLVLLDDKKTCSDKCPEGYTILNGKTCVKCQDPNATQCKEDTPDESTKCKEDYILMPLTKKCQVEEACEDGLFYVEKTNTCQKCPKECKKCEDSSNCTACKHGFDPVDGICKTDCPVGKVLVEGKCVACKDPKCKNCDENLECLKCEEGTVLTNKKCPNECPSGTYPKNGVCKPCSNDCLECDSLLKCKKCKDSFLLEENGNARCVEDCPNSQYEDENDGKCKKCNKGCDKCENGTECEKCAMPLVLRNDKTCSKNCPEGTSLVLINFLLTCYKCKDPNALTCKDRKPEISTKCKEGFNLLPLTKKCVKPDTCKDGKFFNENTK